VRFGSKTVDTNFDIEDLRDGVEVVEYPMLAIFNLMIEKHWGVTEYDGQQGTITTNLVIISLTKWGIF
jgi:hypothetical protein